MNKKDELIKELHKIIIIYPTRDIVINGIADFILERDKKIVEPLVKIREIFSRSIWISLNQESLIKHINQTLKNAGIED